MSRVVSALEDAVAALREQLERSEKGREAERARADAAIGLVDQTMAALADSNARTDRAEAQAKELRALLEQAEAAAERARREALHEAREAAQAFDALRAVEAARLAQGLLARLRAAWRGR
jgi:hypothetical protein